MLWDWFVLNLKIGALSFGSSARIPMYQEAVVDDKKWLTKEEFFEVLTVAQILPGPNLVNLVVYIGYRLFSNRVIALVGLLALSVPGAFLGIALFTFLPMQDPMVERLFQGFSLGSIAVSLVFVKGLLESIGIKVQADRNKKFYCRFAVLILVSAISLLGVPLLWILAIGVSLGIVTEFVL